RSRPVRRGMRMRAAGFLGMLHKSAALLHDDFDYRRAGARGRRMRAMTGKPMTPIYLNEDDVRRALPAAEIYAVVEETLRATAEGRVVNGAKTGFTLDDAAGG